MTPRAQLTSYLTGKWIPPVLGVAANLGIADHLAQRGPATAEELAELTGTNAGALYRVLRAAASVGVFEEDVNSRFAMTDMAELLRSDHADSMRAPVMMFGLEPFWAPYSKILHSVKSGEPAFEETFGTSVYAYLESHPEDAAIFGQAAAAFHREGVRAIVDSYDFSGLGTVVDVGGGNGSLLIEVLRANPSVRGVLLEVEGVLDRADEALTDAGLGHRVDLIAGDFFDEVPPGDAFVIKSCVHNFNDEDAVTVLSVVARSMGPGVPLLVVETVVPPGNDAHYSKLDDIEMLVIAGGIDRTQAQYAGLLEAAGLSLARAIPAGDRFTVLEAYLA
jgi:hypothetical protein